jgi:hypothetical protein
VYHGLNYIYICSRYAFYAARGGDAAGCLRAAMASQRSVGSRPRLGYCRYLGGLKATILTGHWFVAEPEFDALVALKLRY